MQSAGQTDPESGYSKTLKDLFSPIVYQLTGPIRWGRSEILSVREIRECARRKNKFADLTQCVF